MVVGIYSFFRELNYKQELFLHILLLRRGRGRLKTSVWSRLRPGGSSPTIMETIHNSSMSDKLVDITGTNIKVRILQYLQDVL